MMGLQEFLVWLSGGAGASIVVTWVFARWPWFVALPENTRKLLLAVSCAIVALGSYQIVLMVPQSTIEMLAPYFSIVSIAFMNFFLGDKSLAIFRARILATNKKKKTKK
jgi:hypothetical protein